MNWSDWVDFPTVQAIIRHTVSVTVVILCFVLTGFLAERFFTEWLKLWWLEGERLVIICLGVWLVFQLALVLWKRREKLGGPHVSVLA